MNPRILLLAAVLLTRMSFATDANHDGMDDAWQTLYNIAPFTGSADPDGDGRPNLVESINWTNPNDAAHPNAGWGSVLIQDANGDHVDDQWAARYFPQGMVVNALTTPLATTPANGIYSDPDGDGRSNLEESIVFSDPFVADWPWGSINGPPAANTGPGSFTLSFGSAPGMSYLIERSDDLLTWETAQQVWGAGGMQAVTLATGTATSKFFRITLQQTNGGGLDSDGDGLLDWYEINVFHTDPFNADSDGDGIPDGWEAAYGLNPVSAADALADSDGDGIKNLDEFDLGWDPRVDDYTGKTTAISYDNVNRVTAVSAAVTGVKTFTYDNAGNLLSSN